VALPGPPVRTVSLREGGPTRPRSATHGRRLSRRRHARALHSQPCQPCSPAWEGRRLGVYAHMGYRVVARSKGILTPRRPTPTCTGSQGCAAASAPRPAAPPARPGRARPPPGPLRDGRRQGGTQGGWRAVRAGRERGRALPTTWPGGVPPRASGRPAPAVLCARGCVTRGRPPLPTRPARGAHRGACRWRRRTAAAGPRTARCPTPRPPPRPPAAPAGTPPAAAPCRLAATIAAARPAPGPRAGPRRRAAAAAAGGGEAGGDGGDSPARVRGAHGGSSRAEC
jgi:hypothetical protein